jgi:hypothetical protein
VPSEAIRGGVPRDRRRVRDLGLPKTIPAAGHFFGASGPPGGLLQSSKPTKNGILGGQTLRIHGGFVIRANVAELVDALDLGSSGATREGSSPSIRTKRNEDESNFGID